MESLIPEFDTISLIHPTCFATTSHLLEQRKFLSSQPLVFEFEGVPDDDDLEDQELNFFNNNSEFIYHSIPINRNNNNNNNKINSNSNSKLNPSLSPLPKFEPSINKINQEENSNNFNNNNNNNVSISIENIKNQLEILQKEKHLKIPKVKSLNRQKKLLKFQKKRNSFINDKKLISISKTMRNNVFSCLINPIETI